MFNLTHRRANGEPIVARSEAVIVSVLLTLYTYMHAINDSFYLTLDEMNAATTDINHNIILYSLFARLCDENPRSVASAHLV